MNSSEWLCIKAALKEALKEQHSWAEDGAKKSGIKNYKFSGCPSCQSAYKKVCTELKKLKEKR